MRVIKNWILIGFLLISSRGLCQNNYSSEFGFRSDNDAYLATMQDRYYTNGLFITFRHALTPSDTARIVKKIWEAEAGQLMYNAVSGAVSSIGQVDRPFAAYLYGEFKMNWFRKDEQLLQASVQFGTVGPRALGRQAQETLHNTVGFYKINGWQYQVNNEVGLNISFNYMRSLQGWRKADLSLSSSATAGSSFTGASMGLLFRTGAINKLYNSVSTNSRIAPGAGDSTSHKEFFLYLKPSLNLVGYNATIQGGMFRKDKGPVTFRPNPILFSQEVGLMFAQKRWTLDFSLTFQSREIKTQQFAHQYGSASIYYRF